MSKRRERTSGKTLGVWVSFQRLVPCRPRGLPLDRLGVRRTKRVSSLVSSTDHPREAQPNTLDGSSVYCNCTGKIPPAQLTEWQGCGSRKRLLLNRCGPRRFLRVPAGSVGQWLERRYNSDDEGPLELSMYPSNILHGAQVFWLMEERGDAAELRAEAAEKRSPRTR